MKNNVCDRVLNILTCKNLNNKTISINLEDVNYWVDDSDFNTKSTKIHFKHSVDVIWVNMDEETFRKNYLKYKESCNS